MADKLKVELQDENGNIYYLHTSADVVFCEDGTTVEAKLNGKIDKADIIQNATTAATDKVPSAAVAKNLQDQITAQNTKINFAAGLPSIGLSGTPSHIAILNAMDAKGVSLLLLTEEELAGVTGLTGARWGIGLVATKKGSYNRNAFIMIDQADIHYGLYAHSNNETFIKKITGSQI